MTPGSKNLVTAMLASFGIAAPVPDLIGGMTLCLAGAYAAMIFAPPGSRRSLWSTLVAAMVVGLLVAIVHDALLRRWSLHLMMMTGGLLSRWVVLGFAAFGHGAVKRAGQLPGTIKLPWEK